MTMQVGGKERTGRRAEMDASLGLKSTRRRAAIGDTPEHGLVPGGAL